MKFLELHARIKKTIKINLFPCQNYENHEIHTIPRQNNENHEHLIIQRQNY